MTEVAVIWLCMQVVQHPPCEDAFTATWACGVRDLVAEMVERPEGPSKYDGPEWRCVPLSSYVPVVDPDGGLIDE